MLKKTRVKKKTTTQLKKEADRLFSLYIRQKYADSEGMVRCFTCPKVIHYLEGRKINCGHFVSRAYLATRYDERNCRPQCWGCNNTTFGWGGHGKPVEFAAGLQAEYGPGIVEELYAKAKPLIPNFDYQAIIDKYSEQKIREILQKTEDKSKEVEDC